MILYLTSKKNANILDFLNKSEEVLIKKYVGIYSLENFLTKSLNRLSHIDQLVIDRSCIEETDDAFIEMLKTFVKMNKVKIILYIPEMTGELIERLIQSGVYHLITQLDVVAIQRQIKRCVFNDISEEEIRTIHGMIIEPPKAVERMIKKQTVIGIIGVQEHIGVTTIALMMASVIAELKVKVCYIEANTHNDLDCIAKDYDMMKHDHGYHYNGIDFIEVDAPVTEAYDCIIYDFGVSNERGLKGLRHADIKLVITGGRSYEMKKYISLKEKLPKDHRMIVNLSEEGTDFKYYIGYDSNKNYSQENRATIKLILEDYMKEHEDE